MSLLKLLGLIDSKSHSRLHHSERSYNMHLTKDWMDLKFPLFYKFADLYATSEWYLYKKILSILSIIYTDNRVKLIFGIFIKIWFLIKSAMITYQLSFIKFIDIEIVNIRYYLLPMYLLYMLYFNFIEAYI